MLWLQRVGFTIYSTRLVRSVDAFCSGISNEPINFRVCPFPPFRVNLIPSARCFAGNPRRMEFFVVYIIPTICIVAGVALVLKAWSDVRLGIASRSWPFVEGVVQRSVIREEITDDGGTVYGVDVDYEYVVESETYKGNRISLAEYASGDISYANAMIALYKVGSRIRVFYAPENPSCCLLSPGVKGGSWIFLAAGLLAIIVSLVWHWCVPHYYPPYLNNLLP